MTTNDSRRARRVRKGAGLIVLIPVLACFSGTPSERRILGDYTLMRWEDGRTFYVDELDRDLEGGFVLEGTVEQIGWNDRFIVARRRATFRGDPDGWMVLDAQTETIEGPLTDADLAARAVLANVEVVDPSVAWERLR